MHVAAKFNMSKFNYNGAVGCVLLVAMLCHNDDQWFAFVMLCNLLWFVLKLVCNCCDCSVVAYTVVLCCVCMSY